MGDKSAIDWTDATWNPLVGCDHVSDGCGTFDQDGELVEGGCYAAGLASGRLATTPTYQGLAEHGRFNGTIRLLPDRLDQPLRWRRPPKVFVNSMSDLFHPGVPDSYIAAVFARMALARRHTFQLLTKRPGPMASLLGKSDFVVQVAEEATAILERTPTVDRRLSTDGWTPRGDPEHRLWMPPWPLPNLWVGISVEHNGTGRYADKPKWADVRIPPLLRTPAAVRFLSMEPLLGPVDLRRWLSLPGLAPGVDWVIVGGESGPLARPMHPRWVQDLRDQTLHAGVAFFLKQWGAWRWVYEADSFQAEQEAKRRDPSEAYLHLGPWRSVDYDGQPLDGPPTAECATMVRTGGHNNTPDLWPPDLRVRQYPTVKAGVP